MRIVFLPILTVVVQGINNLCPLGKKIRNYVEEVFTRTETWVIGRLHAGVVIEPGLTESVKAELVPTEQFPGQNRG